MKIAARDCWLGSRLICFEYRNCDDSFFLFEELIYLEQRELGSAIPLPRLIRPGLGTSMIEVDVRFGDMRKSQQENALEINFVTLVCYVCCQTLQLGDQSYCQDAFSIRLFIRTWGQKFDFYTRSKPTAACM